MDKKLCQQLVAGQQLNEEYKPHTVVFRLHSVHCVPNVIEVISDKEITDYRTIRHYNRNGELNTILGKIGFALRNTRRTE